MSSGTLAKAPRRMLLSVSSRNQCSTKFSHDELVGLFGPYAGFSTKFLKNRSLTDLFGSVKGDTIKLLLAVGRDNWDLTDYLIKEVLKSSASRYASLLEYFPNAKDTDWELIVAGQRVQVIVPDAKAGGKLDRVHRDVVAGAD